MAFGLNIQEERERRMRFSVGGPVVARVSTLPRARLWDGGDDPCAADVTAENLVTAGKAAIADPVFREALLLASPSLFEAAERLAKGEARTDREARRTLLSLLRYHLRMANRVVPFGLFAGVAPVSEGPAVVSVGSKHRKGVRPDASWLRSVLASLETDPAFMAGLRARANPLCVVRGERLILPQQGDQGETSIRCTAAATAALAQAQSPIVLDDLTDQIHAAFPGGPRALSERLVRSLVTHGFLLTDLHPPMRAEFPLDQALERLEHAAPRTGTVRALSSLREAMAEYAATEAGQDPERPRTVARQMRRLHDSPQPLHVDVAVDALIALPRIVSSEIERAAGALWGITPSREPFPGLDAYLRRFLEHYGTTQLVPLTEVVDPERGLGPIAADDGTARSAGSTPLRDAALAELAAKAMSDGLPEVVLDRKQLHRLAVPGKGSPPPTIDVMATLEAASPRAVDAGEFRLVLGAGAQQAGALNGRFAYLLGDPVAAHCRREARRSDPDAPHALRVALDFSPRTPRGGNVTRTGAGTMPTVHIGSFYSQSSGRICVDDLYIGARRDRLYAYSASLGREVLPSVLDMLNSKRELPAIRLLQAISTGGRTAFHSWNWGPVSDLPRLPRIRYGRTVLCPARWNSALLSPVGGTWDHWCAQVDAWRTAWSVPDHVAVGTGDRRLTLDLRKTMHLRLFREELRRNPHGIIHEAVGVTQDTSGWFGASPHACELVFPLYSNTHAPSHTPLRSYPPLVTGVKPYPLGSEWLSAKLYASPARHNEILTQRLPLLLRELPESMDRWFFLRYADPDPHLRLRFHARPGVLTRQVLPVIGAWAADLRERGLAHVLILDEYCPETARYGGPDMIEAAERAFHADSLAVLEQLQVLPDPACPLDTAVLSCLNYLDLARAFTGGVEVLPSLFATARLHPDRTALRKQRALATPLADDSDGWSALRQIPGGERIFHSWRNRAPAVSSYAQALHSPHQVDRATPHGILRSLMHMHHNRLASGSDNEAASLALLRDLVHARQARQRQPESTDR
ncbi:lantibiotic dehydratase [Streptomyces olivoreticuli]|uniref:lantibiotic dehydratase n=1 Tax=Streptomyces olivoreticuli TaxID=68246 RepID=UPI0026589DCA|nr:lantibiotic dehydratase [Streptomyces olivoreticuli]WKK24090.1 lantibiotic dehydratase [Streptomyces olivoreticuli]